MSEIWKDIPGYEGIYQASNIGRIKSLCRIIESKIGVKYMRAGKILSPPLYRGYRKIRLNKFGQGRTFYVHKLIALTFIGERPIKDGKALDIDHIDEDRLNNSIENLRYISHRENSSRSSRKRERKTSKYIGVCWYKTRGQWLCRIQIKGVTRHIGYFDDEFEAGESYKKRLRELNE